MAKVGKLDDLEAFLKEVNRLKEPCVWDIEAGDLVLPGIAFTTRKNILVYNTNPRNGFSPIFVVSPSTDNTDKFYNTDSPDNSDIFYNSDFN